MPSAPFVEKLGETVLSSWHNLLHEMGSLQQTPCHELRDTLLGVRARGAGQL